MKKNDTKWIAIERERLMNLERCSGRAIGDYYWHRPIDVHV